jgi:hypothetical protein
MEKPSKSNAKAARFPLSIDQLLTVPSKEREEASHLPTSGRRIPTHYRLPPIREIFDLNAYPDPAPLTRHPSWVGVMISPLGFPLSSDESLSGKSPSPEAPYPPEVLCSPTLPRCPLLEGQASNTIRVLQHPVRARSCGLGDLGTCIRIVLLLAPC